MSFVTINLRIFCKEKMLHRSNMFVEIKHKYQENSVGVQYFAVNPKLVTNHKIFLIKDKNLLV